MDYFSRQGPSDGGDKEVDTPLEGEACGTSPYPPASGSGHSPSPRVRMRFPTHSSSVDWGIDSGDTDDALEAIAMARIEFKERSKTGEEDCWADVVDWEAFEAQKVQPWPTQPTAGWETTHRHDPGTSHCMWLLGFTTMRPGNEGQSGSRFRDGCTASRGTSRAKWPPQQRLPSQPCRRQSGGHPSRPAPAAPRYSGEPRKVRIDFGRASRERLPYVETGGVAGEGAHTTLLQGQLSACIQHPVCVWPT